MVTKRQKRHGRAKKISPKGLFIVIFALFLGSLTILALSHYFSNFTGAISPPIYEEIYSISSDFRNEIGKIDTAIYESLYQRGVPGKNILFLAVKPKYEGRYDWDFTELLVKLSNINSALELKKFINIELSQLRPAVSYKTEQIAKSEIVCHIFALGFYTHKIRLIYDGYQEELHKVLPKVAIIIDDLGYARKMASHFIRLDLPLSFSVFPLAPNTKAIADEANKMGRELMLHLPMEPKNYPSRNPGPGVLLTRMDEKEIRRNIDNYLKRIPGVQGVNNHMGSYFTERQDKMAIVLSEIKKRNLFYVDSRTTGKTIAFKLAKKMGVPVANRNVFLDNDLSPKATKFQMERLLGMARHSGTAIGIGHPNRVTLKLLKDYLPKLKTEVKVVPVSKLVN